MSENRRPIDAGMDPVMELKLRLMKLREDSSRIKVGMSPDMELL